MVCIWEEVVFPESIEQFKQLISGEQIYVDVKNEKGKSICINRPIIMTSNLTLEEQLKKRGCINELGLRERIIAIHANTDPFVIRDKTRLDIELAAIEERDKEIEKERNEKVKRRREALEDNDD